MREAASDLAVRPGELIFTSQFETATLIPSVDYEFRGRTPLPGAGSGVHYTSSHPNLVAVSSAGVVRPLAPTGTTDVRIQVAFDGLAPVEVPVTVDFTQTVVGLVSADLDADGHYELSRLNHRFPLPGLTAVFSSGRRTEITTQFPVDWTVEGGAAAVLDVDPFEGLLSTAIIPATSPATLVATMRDFPDINANIPVVARDALPEVALSAPGSVQSARSSSFARLRATTSRCARCASIWTDRWWRPALRLRTRCPWRRMKRCSGAG